MIVANSFPNYSICGLPFYLSGEVPDWRNLAHRTTEEITREGIQLLLDCTARTINPQQKNITVVDREMRSHNLNYDRLIIATGAVSTRPQITKLDLPGVFLLHSMADSFAVHQYLTTSVPDIYAAGDCVETWHRILTQSTYLPLGTTAQSS